MTQADIIFRSDDHPLLGNDGVQVMVACTPSGQPDAVAICDDNEAVLIELNPETALMLAHAILDKLGHKNKMI